MKTRPSTIAFRHLSRARTLFDNRRDRQRSSAGRLDGFQLDGSLVRMVRKNNGVTGARHRHRQRTNNEQQPNNTTDC